MGLTEKAKKVADDLSGGQSQRVMIARALMHRPGCCSSTALHRAGPAGPAVGARPIRSLQDEDMTVVIAPHDMDEAHKLSDRVGIVDRGKLLALDTPDALVRSLPGEAPVEPRSTRAAPARSR